VGTVKRLLCGQCVVFVVAACLGAGGCGDPAPTSAAATQPAQEVQVEPTAVLQSRAYPEAATGYFVSLADFEDAPDRPHGQQQIRHFSIEPSSGKGTCKFVVNVTRTGAGAMEVTLNRGAALVFRIPGLHNFSEYTLLSLALHSESLRDDLQVTLQTDASGWRSHRTLIRPGWNTVLVDIQRLKQLRRFDARGVRALRVAFADATGAVTFNLDDIILIDNRRRITPTPPGMKLRKTGLDYRLELPFRSRPVHVSQFADGLWRLGVDQASVAMAPPGGRLGAGREKIEMMGDRKVGQVKVLETNAVRLRLVSTWYFPARAGEWASLAVRRIRWVYTFYPHGRWITHVELNNSGGKQIGSLCIGLPQEAAVAGRGLTEKITVAAFAGPVGQWSYLCANGSADGKTYRRNYLNSGRVQVALGDKTALGEGDFDKDGFDESRGCYYVRAKAGNCRFTVFPPPGGLLYPVFHVDGRWEGKVTVASEGLAIRDVVRLPDGSVLFAFPGRVSRPTAVEVAGRANPLGGGFEPKKNTPDSNLFPPTDVTSLSDAGGRCNCFRMYPHGFVQTLIFAKDGARNGR